MMESWEWLFYVNLPCLLFNLWGLWLSVFRISPIRPARLCFWINSGAMLWTVQSILLNSFSIVATYGHGEG